MDVSNFIEAIQRHYDYVEKIPSDATQANLNAARVKKFVRNIEQLVIDADDGAKLTDVIDAGPWTIVP